MVSVLAKRAFEHVEEREKGINREVHWKRKSTGRVERQGW